jgi:hypothetical protein
MECRIGSATNPVLVIAAVIPWIVLPARSHPQAMRTAKNTSAKHRTDPPPKAIRKRHSRRLRAGSCATVMNSSAGIATL